MDLSRYDNLNEFVSKVAVPQNTSSNNNNNKGQLEALQGNNTSVNKVDVFGSSEKENGKSGSSDIGATIASIAKIAAMFV